MPRSRLKTSRSSSLAVQDRRTVRRAHAIGADAIGRAILYALEQTTDVNVNEIVALRSGRTDAREP